jgi:predicted esterase
MDLPVSSRQITVALLVVTVVGAAGWASPFVRTADASGSGYSVEHVFVRGENRITTAALYLPDGDEEVAGVVFGAGSGTAPALYSNYGAALATNGFAVLIAGGTRELEPGRPVRWETFRGTDVALERGAENYLDWIAYLEAHPRVDAERLVLGGHSGGANAAYRAAYERPDVRGVVAIAGRFPPERNEPLETNLLLATGSEDSLVPPGRLVEVSETLTGTPVGPGERVGSFEDGTAVRVVVVDGESHLSEADSPALVRETTAWARRSVGESPPDRLGVTVRPLGSVLRQFLWGLLGVVGATALAGRASRPSIGGRDVRESLVPFVWLVGFLAVTGTTVSRRLYHLGPMPSQAPKYAVLAALLVGVGAVLRWTGSRSARLGSGPGSAVLDVTYLFVPAAAFVLVSTRFVTFQLVTTTVLSSVVLGLLLPFLGLLAVLDVRRTLRWLVVGVGILWVLPAIVPPYL